MGFHASDFPLDPSSPILYSAWEVPVLRGVLLGTACHCAVSIAGTAGQKEWIPVVSLGDSRSRIAATGLGVDLTELAQEIRRHISGVNERT